MSNKRELAKISREIKSIKAQLNKSAGVTWGENENNWYLLDLKEQRKLFNIFAKKVIPALPRNGKVSIRSVWNDWGSGSNKTPNSIYWMKDGIDDARNYIQISPIPGSNMPPAIYAFKDGVDKVVEEFPGDIDDIAKHFSEVGNWAVRVLKSQVDNPGLFE